MAFSVKTFTEERLVQIEDEIKQTIRARDNAVASHEAKLKDLLIEREEWLRVRDAFTPPQPAPKPAAKKAVAKK